MVAAVLKELNSGGVGIARNDKFLKLQTMFVDTPMALAHAAWGCIMQGILKFVQNVQVRQEWSG